VQIHILGRGYRLARHVLHEFKVSFSLEAASEGPWHQVGEWDDWLGNRREDEAAFHSIAECGPCESMCNECYRDLASIWRKDDEFGWRWLHLLAPSRFDIIKFKGRGKWKGKWWLLCIV
jgi:hypothetical protein